MIVMNSQPGADPLGGPHRGAVATLAGLFLASAAFVVWACVVEITISASGTGRIVPSHSLQVVQNLEGGIVKAVLVKEGDQVERDQVVARIQDTEFDATLKEASANYAGLQALSARLIAEAESKEPHFSAALSASHPDLIAKEQNLFESRRAQLEATVQGFREESNRARTTIATAKENLPIYRNSLTLAREKRSITYPQVMKGLISKVELLGIDQNILELQAKINEGTHEIPAAQAQLAESEQRIESERQRFKSEALKELTEIKVKLSGQKGLVAANQDRVARREVRSPMRGIVKRVYVNSVGEIIKPGDNILDIVPTDDQLIVEAKFSPKDIAFIHPGQKAFIRVTAYDSSIYGALPAKVVRIAADTTTTEKNEVYYTARVEATGGFDGKTKSLPLMPGMIAEVDVVTGKRSVFDYLAKPIMKLQYSAMHER